MSSTDFRTEAGKVQLAQRLAHVEKDVRDEATGEVEDLLRGDTSMTRLDYLKLWKALYYTVWLADKVPIQQEVIGRIAQMQHLLTSSERREWFVDCFFETIMREWMHIDKWRVDKFLSFIRKMVRHQLAGIARAGWQPEDVQRYLHLMEHRVMPSPPSGVRMQVMSVLVEEACLVAGPTLTSAQIRLLLRPVYKLLLTERSSVAVVRKACSVIKSAAERQIRLLQQQVADLTERAQAAEANPSPSDEKAAAATTPAVDSPLAPLLALDLSALALDVFEVAGEEDTWDTARESLYECHEAVMECAAESDDLQMELAVLGGEEEEEEEEEGKGAAAGETTGDEDVEEEEDDEEAEAGEEEAVAGFAVGAASLLQEIKARRERRREERGRKRDDRKRGREAGKKRARPAAAAGGEAQKEVAGGNPKKENKQAGKKEKKGQNEKKEKKQAGKKAERAAGKGANADAGVAKPQRSKKRRAKKQQQ